MDVLTFIIGLIIDVITVSLAIKIVMRRVNKIQPAIRTAHKWSIVEIVYPRIIAENMGAIELPKNAKVVLLYCIRI